MHGQNCYPITHTPTLWTRIFKVPPPVVYDFGVKYTNASDVHDLIQLLQYTYIVTTYFTWSEYCELTLLWDCHKRTEQYSIVNFIKIVFSHFQYALPLRSKDAPYKHITSTYPQNHLTHSQLILPHHSSHHKLYAYMCVSNSWNIIELC